jgi:hypothetical protein
MNPTIKSAEAESRETAYITRYSVRGFSIWNGEACWSGVGSGDVLSSGNFNFERMLSFRLTTRNGGEKHQSKTIASVPRVTPGYFCGGPGTAFPGAGQDHSWRGWGDSIRMLYGRSGDDSSGGRRFRETSGPLFIIGSNSPCGGFGENGGTDEGIPKVLV